MNQAIDNNQRWVSFLNQSGSEIPPYAVISFKSDKGASSGVANYKMRLLGKKFADGDPCAAVAFNSGAKVSDGKYGVCTFPVNGPCWARVDSADMPSFANSLSGDDDWVGRDWGPTNGKWSITPAGSGFTICSRPDISLNRVLVLAKDKVLVCKASAAISKGSSGTCVVYTGSSSAGITSTGYELQVYARTGAISSGDWVDVVRLPWGFEALGGGGGGCPAANQIWTILLGGLPSGGTFTVSLTGSGTTGTTSSLAFNIDAATIQSELESLTGVGSGNVTVVGTRFNFQVAFVGDLAHLPVTLTVNPANLTGSGVFGTQFQLQAAHA